jgi:C1A family cysteine protease
LHDALKGDTPIKSKVDLREWCSPIRDQGPLGSCTANAGTGLVEYFENRAFGHHTDVSRRFLYKVARNLTHNIGDSGVSPRAVMASLVFFGLCPESYWPYWIDEFDNEPTPFCYAYTQKYRAIKYVRLDQPTIPYSQALKDIKTFLSFGLPSMFGFTCFESLDTQTDFDEMGRIPFPCPSENATDGHTVVAVGYDDDMKITNDKKETKGAFLIRNSWGMDWGDLGYGWIPYEYLLQGLANDWWTLINQDWINTEWFEDGD